jgi:hypothetical protein
MSLAPLLLILLLLRLLLLLLLLLLRLRLPSLHFGFRRWCHRFGLPLPAAPPLLCLLCGGTGC